MPSSLVEPFRYRSASRSRAYFLSTALITGTVVVGLPQAALAQCIPNGNELNCNNTATENEVFTPGGDFDVNVLGGNNAAHLTGSGADGTNSPVITINAGSGGNHNGVIYVAPGTSITGGSNGKLTKSGNRDGIEVNDGANIEFYIEGDIFADNLGSKALDLNGNSSTQYTINIGVDSDGNVSGSGQLGNSPGDSIIDVSGGVQPTTINNYGTMNGNVAFGTLLSDPGNGAVTINNYSVNTWNTSGDNIFTNNDDVVNNGADAISSGVINTSGLSTWYFKEGGDTILNDVGSDFNTSGTTTFNFDNNILGLEIGAQGEDQLINSRGSTFDTTGLTTFYFGGEADLLSNNRGATFTTTDTTSFFFGSGSDRFENTRGGDFMSNDITTFDMGSGDDVFENSRGATFTATGATSFLFDGIAGPTGNDTFYNERGATFTASDLTVLSFRGGEDMFVNRYGATFNANGGSLFTFGDDADTFRNETGATFNSNGLTYIAMGDGDDAAYNSSQINVDNTLFFTGLENFYNAGGMLNMRDGATDDLISLSGNGTFNGGTDSRIGLDAFLGSTGDPSTGSDLLTTDGSVAGSTGLEVAKLNTDTVGMNTDGIAAVRYGAGGTIGTPCVDACRDGDAVYIASGSDNFISIGGVGLIEDGLLAWGLYQDDTENQFEFRSLAGPGAVGAPSIITGAQSIFYETLNVAQEQLYANSFLGGVPALGYASEPDDGTSPFTTASVGGSASRGGIWARAGGNWNDRDASVTQGGVTFDTGTSQDIFSILGGAEFKPVSAMDGPIRIGVFGGYVTSDLDTNLHGVSTEYKGGVAGAYFAFNNGAAFFDATIKGDWLDTTYSYAGMQVNGHTNTYGGLLNAGYRFTSGNSYFEPIVSAALSHTDATDFSSGGVSLTFGDTGTARLGAGARIGTATVKNGNVYGVSLVGKIWNEFSDANTVTIASGPDSITLSDEIEGIFGEVEATASVSMPANGFSGFISGGAKVGDDFSSWSAKIGLKKGF